MRSNPSRLALVSLALSAALSAGAIACKDDDGDGSTSESTLTSAATARPIATPAQTGAATAPLPTQAESGPTGTIEVQGVVGAVDVAARTIDIKPTGDAKYTKIILSPATTIKRAGGGSLRLQDIRPSDRIIAFGRPGDDPTTLLSTDVTIQAVVPGAQPGG